MLRRKLLTRIGLLVVCFVAGAVVAIYLLQAAISDVDRINQDGIALIDGAHVAQDCVAQIEDARDAAPQGGSTSTLERRLAEVLAVIGAHRSVELVGSPQARAYERVAMLVPEFLHPGDLSQEQVKANRAGMRLGVRELGGALQAYVAAEQAGFGKYFRGLVVGLTLAALVMVNVAVFVLLRTAQVVLRPVAKLVEGSRELAAENFDHRVGVDQQDEFGELARAYNRLADQLQSNEERKAEALRQLAVTLNHDLNNAMATIEMQLSLLDRQSGSNSNLARYFRDIQSTLSRMGRTVASLKHIRRVVLTDYVDGQKMVDIEQSLVEPLPPPARG